MQESRDGRLNTGATDLIAGAVIALNGAAMAIALAVLIFAGPLATEAPRAIAAFLFGAAVVAALLAWKSQTVPAVGIIQDGPAVVMVPVAAGIAATEGLGPTAVLAALTGVSLATAATMAALSRWRLAGAVRYLPSSVLVAFIAGTGWYLTKGGVEVMVGGPIGLDDLTELFAWTTAQKWLPGAAMGLAILALGRDHRVPPHATSLLVGAATALFFVVVALGSSLDAAEQAGWLIGPFPAGSGLKILTPSELSGLDWTAFIDHLPGLAAVVAIAVIGTLLNLSGLDLLTGERADQRNELRVTATVALLTAPLSSSVSFVAIGDSMLARKMGVTRRHAAWLGATLIALLALFGTDVIAAFPRLVAGGTLVAIGLDLLVRWLGDLRSAPSSVDRTASVCIVAAMATVGILEGLAFGIAIACALFVVRYSRIDHVRRQSRGFHTSRVDRTPAEADRLLAVADRVVVFELEGFLFFGSIIGVADRVREECGASPEVDGELAGPSSNSSSTDPSLRPAAGVAGLDAIVVDFRSVSGIDQTGIEALAALAVDVRQTGARFVCSSLAPPVAAASSTIEFERFATLDDAIESVENGQLATSIRAVPVEPSPPEPLSPALRAALERERVPAGSVLVHEGSASTTLHLIVRGALVATSCDADGTQIRLRRFGSGSIVGEIGFFGDVERTATVTAVSDCDVLTLSRQRYLRLRQDEPALALELHDHVLAAQAVRASSLTDLVTRSIT